MQLLPVALAVLAYRDLIQLSPRGSVSDEVEEWFFLPSDAAPAAVLAMALWLLFRRRSRLRALVPQPGPVWLTASLLAGGASILGWATVTEAPGLLAPSLALTVLGLGCLHAGPPAVRILRLPAGFLLFAVPIPPPLVNEIVFSLQLWTAQYVGWLLFLLGIPSLVVGDVISQPDETFRVIETCSGFRSCATLIMLSVLVVDLFGRRRLHALALVASAPVVGFALNGVRVLGLILNPYSQIATVHALQGALILLAGLTLLCGIDGLLARVSAWVRAGVRRPTLETTQEQRPESVSAESWPVSSRQIAIGTLTLAGLAAITLWLPPWEAYRPPFQVDLMAGLQQAEGWTSSRRELDRVFLGSVGFDHFVYRRFEAADESVDLMVAIDDHPDGRFRSVFSPKIALPGGGWSIVDSWNFRLGPDGLSARALVLRSGKNLRLSYSWYQGSLGLEREILRSLLALDFSPFPREIEAAAIRISTRLDGSGPEALEAAQDRLSRFLALVRPQLATLEQRLTRQPTS